jgi:hypothetical protein
MNHPINCAVTNDELTMFKYLRCFYYNADSVGRYRLTHGQCNLFGQPLLDL